MSFFRNLNQATAQVMANPAISATFAVLSRLLLALLFILAGFGKLGAGYEPTAQYMASMGVPAALLPLVILLELGGGLALLFGFQTRLVALALAIFCVLSGIMFHGTPDQQTMLLKNLAIAGGMLSLALNGGGRAALDGEYRDTPPQR